MTRALAIHKILKKTELNPIMIFLGSEMVQVKLMVVRRVFGSGLAILARFLDVAVLEEEALVVRPWIVIHVELGPEVAVVQDGALMMT